MQVQAVGSVVPSPDGKLAAYTQTKAVMEEEKSEQLTHIFLARADGSGSIQLTQGDKSCNAPLFSPDGRFVYFKSDRTGKTNLFRMPVDGGEAERLTDWKGSVGSLCDFAGRQVDRIRGSQGIGGRGEREEAKARRPCSGRKAAKPWLMADPHGGRRGREARAKGPRPGCFPHHGIRLVTRQPLDCLHPSAAYTGR